MLTAGRVRFTYGAFITEALSFLISAAVVCFVIVLPVVRLLHLFERDRAATERDCPECDRSIPIQARRCPECTGVLVHSDSEPADAAPRGGPSPVMGPEG